MTRPDDGLDCVRGLLVALPLSIAFWAGIFWMMLQ